MSRMGSGASAQEKIDDDNLFNLNLTQDAANEKVKSSTGEVRYANGDVYMGKWRYDQKHGRGKYTYCENSEEGILYEGSWKHNVRHGEGKFFYRNGDSEFMLMSVM